MQQPQSKLSAAPPSLPPFPPCFEPVVFQDEVRLIPDPARDPKRLDFVPSVDFVPCDGEGRLVAQSPGRLMFYPSAEAARRERLLRERYRSGRAVLVCAHCSQSFLDHTWLGQCIGSTAQDGSELELRGTSWFPMAVQDARDLIGDPVIDLVDLQSGRPLTRLEYARVRMNFPAGGLLPGQKRAATVISISTGLAAVVAILSAVLR